MGTVRAQARTVAPDTLPGLGVALVLVMNPVYAQKIAGMVMGLSVQAPMIGV